MQHLVVDQQHGPIGQGKPLLCQLMPEGIIAATIANLESRYATAQRAELCKMATERAATVIHEDRVVARVVRACFRGLIHWIQGCAPSAWRSEASTGVVIAAALVVLLCWGVRPAWADRVASPETYRCGGEPLIATLHSGPVDDLSIPNRSGSTLPGAFVVLEWQAQAVQLPRTNNAGAPSFTDGRWWWSLEDPDHPDLRLRRGLGDVVQLSCER